MVSMNMPIPWLRLSTEGQPQGDLVSRPCLANKVEGRRRGGGTRGVALCAR